MYICIHIYIYTIYIGIPFGGLPSQVDPLSVGNLPLLLSLACSLFLSLSLSHSLSLSLSLSLSVTVSLSL